MHQRDAAGVGAGAKRTVSGGAWSSSSSTSGSAQDAAKAQQLIEDILDVVRTAGPQAGAVRSLQAARAGLFTALELLRDGDAAELFAALSRGVAPKDELLARVLRKFFEKLGATYVKLGQFIASSPTLFPEAYVREFQNCLDKTEETSFKRIERIVEKDLGKPISSVFRYFEQKPIASASIAQVHAAVLLSGEEVVVKVQKPGVGGVLQADLGFLYIAARVLEYLNPQLSRSSFVDLISEIRNSMLDELDFEKELQNLEVFRGFLAENKLDGVAAAPKPFREASSKRVLTMERFDGVPLVDLDGIRAYSANPEGTLITALNVWALSVRNCEIFHADVHAGNLLVMKDGRIGFIDFGIVGRVPPKIWDAIEGAVEALAREDSRGIARSLIQMGATDAQVDEAKFAEDIRGVLDQVRSLQTEVVIRGRQDGQVTAEVGLDENQVTDLLLDLVRVTDSNGLKLPREFALLVKQALYFDRYNKLLAPELDPLRDERVNLGLSGSAAGSSTSRGSPRSGGPVVIDV